jgi:hypothetical protein
VKAALALVALLLSAAVPEAAFACSQGPVLIRDLNRSVVIATGVFHIVRSEQRDLPPPVGGYEIEGIVELRDARVLRNRGRKRDPIQFRFLFHYATDCAFGYLPMEGERAKVWLHGSTRTTGPLELFYYEKAER